MEFKVTHEESFCKARLNRVIILEDMNFFWDRPELNKLAKLWKDEVPIELMAEHFNRSEDEILLAIIHLARKDKITSRKVGIFNEFIRFVPNAENS